MPIQISEPRVSATKAHPIARGRSRAARTSPAPIVITDAAQRRASAVGPLVVSAIRVDASTLLYRSPPALVGSFAARRPAVFGTRSPDCFERGPGSSETTAKGDNAGPFSTWPSGAKCEPWQGQSQHFSNGFQWTRQPI